MLLINQTLITFCTISTVQVGDGRVRRDADRETAARVDLYKMIQRNTGAMLTAEYRVPNNVQWVGQHEQTSHS